jgi:hypothetical protein
LLRVQAMSSRRGARTLPVENGPELANWAGCQLQFRKRRNNIFSI